MKKRRVQRVLAVSSGGGHWIQLQRLRPVWDEFDMAYVSVREGYSTDVEGARFYAVPDSNLTEKWAMICTAFAVLRVLVKERPDVVVSTGAAPGFFAVFFGKMFGARTIWLDSMANVEELSRSGARVGRFSDLWLTQWQHLATEKNGLEYKGSVL